MTRSEATKILAMLRVAYPAFYSRSTPEDAQMAVNVWAEMFQYDDYQIVCAAVKAVINAGTKDGYPPDIGAIKEQIRRFYRPVKDSAMEAWNEVKKAMVYYDARNCFKALPELTRRVVGGPNQLREWALMEVDEVNTVVQSNFLRAYRAAEQDFLAYKALPEDVQRIVAQIQEGMMLNGPDGQKDELKAKAEPGAAGQITGAGDETGHTAKGADPGVSHPGAVS